MNMNEIERDTEKLAALLGTTSDSQKALIRAYLLDARMTGFEDSKAVAAQAWNEYQNNSG